MDRLSQMIYPSGRVQGIQDGAAQSNYATVQYNALGGVSSLAMRNGITEAVTYNHRGQMTQLTTGSAFTMGLFPCAFDLAHCTSGNNGNIRSQKIQIPGLTWTQAYSYDPANWLTGVAETGSGASWNETYRYTSPGGVVTGNRWLDLGSSARTGLPALTLETAIGPDWYLGNNRVNGWGLRRNRKRSDHRVPGAELHVPH